MAALFPGQQQLSLKEGDSSDKVLGVLVNRSVCLSAFSYWWTTLRQRVQVFATMERTLRAIWCVFNSPKLWFEQQTRTGSYINHISCTIRIALVPSAVSAGAGFRNAVVLQNCESQCRTREPKKTTVLKYIGDNHTLGLPPANNYQYKAFPYMNSAMRRIWRNAPR